MLEVRVERCAGIDLGKKFLLVCVLIGLANQKPVEVLSCREPRDFTDITFETPGAEPIQSDRSPLALSGCTIKQSAFMVAVDQPADKGPNSAVKGG